MRILEDPTGSEADSKGILEVTGSCSIPMCLCFSEPAGYSHAGPLAETSV